MDDRKRKTHEAIQAAHYCEVEKLRAKRRAIEEAWQRDCDVKKCEIKWKPLSERLLRFQRTLAAEITEEFDKGAHGRVVCGPPGVGKSYLGAAIAAAVECTLLAMVVAPEANIPQWITALRVNGCPAVLRLNAQTLASDVANARPGTVILLSADTIIRRASGTLPPVSLLVIDERAHGAVRVKMLAEMRKKCVLILSASPPDPQSCFIIGNGRIPEHEIYHRCMKIIDAEDVLPPIHIHRHAVTVQPISYAERFAKEAEISMSVTLADKISFEHYHRAKLAIAIRMACGAPADEKSLIAVESLQGIDALLAEMFAAELADLGLTRANFVIINTDAPIQTRIAQFAHLRNGTVPARICLVKVSLVTQGLDLEFFANMMIIAAIYDLLIFHGVVGRLRRYDPTGQRPTRKVYDFYTEGTHEELTGDRRYFQQLPGRLNAVLTEWVQQRVEQEIASKHKET